MSARHKSNSELLAEAELAEERKRRVAENWLKDHPRSPVPFAANQLVAPSDRQLGVERDLVPFRPRSRSARRRARKEGLPSSSNSPRPVRNK